MFGFGEIDYCFLFQFDEVEFVIVMFFDIIIGFFIGSQLEDNFEEMFWFFILIFYCWFIYIQKFFDDNEFEVWESLVIQDGFEVFLVEFECF